MNHNGIYLVDGGTINPVPADVVRAIWARTFIIAVNVLNDPQKNKRWVDRGKKSNKMPSIFNTMIQSIYIMEYGIVRPTCLKADILIEPDVSAMNRLSFIAAPTPLTPAIMLPRPSLPEIMKMLSNFELVPDGNYILHLSSHTVSDVVIFWAFCIAMLK